MLRGVLDVLIGAQEHTLRPHATLRAVAMIRPMKKGASSQRLAKMADAMKPSNAFGLDGAMVDSTDVQGGSPSC